AAAAAGAARRAAADLPPARTPAPASAAAPVARSAMATGDTAGATSGGREPPGAGGSGHRRGRPIPAGAGPQRPPRRPGVPCATPLTRAGDLPGDLAPARSRPTTARPGRCEVADVFDLLEHEWARLRGDRTARRRLRDVCAAAGGARSLADVERYVRSAGPQDADRVLLALVRRAVAGDGLAARVLLQLLLPG